MLMNFYIKYSIAFSSEFIMESAEVLFGVKLNTVNHAIKTTCM